MLFLKMTWLGWRLEAAPAIGRFTLSNQNRDKLLQFQNSRLHLNWRKSDRQKPGYDELVENFETTYHLVDAFTKEHEIGPLVPNQWELTYVDAFPRPDDWETAADWSNLLPGLFGQLFSAKEFGLKLEYRAAEWSFEIEPKRARLHISAQAGRWGDDPRDSLLVTWTALDWRKKQRTRADVYSTVRMLLDELPRAYTPEIYQQKCDAVYQHVYDSYPGEGQSIEPAPCIHNRANRGSRIDFRGLPDENSRDRIGSIPFTGAIN
jgi:hypothetical protein